MCSIVCGKKISSNVVGTYIDKMRNVVRREYLLFFLRGLYIGFEPGITHGQVHGYM